MFLYAGGVAPHLFYCGGPPRVHVVRPWVRDVLWRRRESGRIATGAEFVVAQFNGGTGAWRHQNYVRS